MAVPAGRPSPSACCCPPMREWWLGRCPAGQSCWPSPGTPKQSASTPCGWQIILAYLTTRYVLGTDPWAPGSAGPCWRPWRRRPPSVSVPSCPAPRSASSALLAKMAVTVDEVSGGRLTLGLGAGSQPEEFVAFGYPTDDAIGRFEEAVTIIGGLLRDGQIDFVGRHSRARDCGCGRVGHSSGPPILIAARSPHGSARRSSRRRMERGVAEPGAGLGPRIAAIDAACRKVGRDPASRNEASG